MSEPNPTSPGTPPDAPRGAWRPLPPPPGIGLPTPPSPGTWHPAPPPGTPGTPPSPTPQRTPVWRRWWAITGYVVVALAVIGSISGNPAPEGTGTAGSRVLAADTTSAAPTTSEPTRSETLRTTSPTPTASSPAPTTAPAKPVAPPRPRAAVYRGKGAKVLSIAKPSDGAVLVALTHSGRSNFAVWTLDADLQQSELLVNEIGRYRGTVLMDGLGGTTKRLKIEADGGWTVSVQELTAAPRFGKGRPIGGTGDAVVIYTGDAGVITSDHRGRSNFVVTAYADDEFPDLIVNEIGRYHGEGTIGDGPRVVAVNADGKWSLRVE